MVMNSSLPGQWNDSNMNLLPFSKKRGGIPFSNCFNVWIEWIKGKREFKKHSLLDGFESWYYSVVAGHISGTNNRSKTTFYQIVC